MLTRRSGERFTANIWPGFVDAMTAILLILMFILSIFMIVQSVLRDTISSQKMELDEQQTELSQLGINLEELKNELGLLKNEKRWGLITTISREPFGTLDILEDGWNSIELYILYFIFYILYFIL